MANPWSAFYWRDYVGDTGHLSLEQHGAYLLLMAHYYMTGRPLPANASVLHRVCRCTTDADRSAVDQVLAEFFTLKGEIYSHGRIDRELAKALDISEKRRAAANAKHHKANRANAVQKHAQPQPQPQPQSQAKPTSSPFLEKEFVYSKEQNYSQADFDERDFRKLRDARRTVELKLGHGWGSHLTDEQIFEEQCAQAGLTVQRALEVSERATRWPSRSEITA